MLNRLLSFFVGRTRQAYQISRWRRVKLTKMNTEECLAIRRACTCLFTVIENGIEALHPREVGALVSVLHKCVEALVAYIPMVEYEFGYSAVDEINIFSKELKDYVARRFRDVDICDLSILELAALVTTMLHLERESNPDYAAARADAERPGYTQEQFDKLFSMQRRIMKRINLALFHGLLPKLRAEYSLRDMVMFTRAYRREDRNLDDDFPLLRDDIVELDVDETEAEYKVAGERVKPSAFCKPAKSLPGDTECSVCLIEFDGTEEAEDELPVLTECGHFFHKVCLDKWVNDSAMKASNTCPSCRKVLCEPRERLHASAEDVLEAQDENDASSSDSSAAGSLVAVPSWPRLQRLNARITTHLSLVNNRIVDRDVSGTDDSSNSSGDTDGGVVSRRVLEIIRAERRDQMRIVNV